ncbi:MAG: 5-bromo-4-chloroindolyl phosphate hydrolysis family protein [Paracoccaceae bacterium]
MVARRYSGKYTAGGRRSTRETAPHAPVFRGRKVVRGKLRANLLFFVPLPLLLSGLGAISNADTAKILASLGSFGLLILAAWLLRDGLKAEDAYAARKVSRPPAIPRKAFASALTAAGIFVAAWFGWGQGIAASAVLALIAAAAHVAAFGTDPFRRKGMEGVSDFEADRVARAVEKAETLVSEIMDAAKRIGDRDIEARIERLCASARAVFRTVEEDPRDLARARKFLSVYLMGTRDATAKFAEVHAQNPGTEALHAFDALLSDLETSFANQRERLLEDNRSDLEIEIEVLRERLQQEGLTAR